MSQKNNSISTQLSSNMSNSFPISQIETYFLRNNIGLVQADTDFYMKEFKHYNLLSKSNYSIYKINDLITDGKKRKFDTKKFHLINQLSIKYLNKSIEALNTKPKRPATPPGPLFKKSREKTIKYRKHIILNTKKLPPPPSLSPYRSLIIEGYLPKTEIRRKIIAKQDPNNPNSLICEWNMPNITFKFRIEI